MDRDDTEFMETLRKHGWHGVHWDDRQANVRDSIGLKVATTVIGTLTIVPLALSAWQFVRWRLG